MQTDMIKMTAKERFLRDEADLIAVIRKAASWSGFARSLTEAADYHRFPWSDRQIAAARSMAAKIAQSNAPAPSGQADLSRVRDMFATALANGLRRPTYRAEGLVLSLAPASGKNAGAVYVKGGETYLGKVMGTAFSGVRGTDAEGTLRSLLAISADPMAAAIRHGQLTGRCSCCGRELTNAVSVELGIGPICRGKWGI